MPIFVNGVTCVRGMEFYIWIVVYESYIPEEVGNRFLQNVGNYPQRNTAP
jgi:hypothetical protein